MLLRRNIKRNINDLDLDNILLNEKLYNFFLIHDVAYKILLDLKPLRIIFVKVDGYIWNYDETKYLPLFHSNEKCERIFYRITYLFMLKSNNLGAYKYTKIKINADDDLLYCRILW